MKSKKYVILGVGIIAVIGLAVGAYYVSQNSVSNEKLVTPEEAKLICEKSPATIRRYFKLLIATGYVIAEGNTNNIVYKVVKK